MKIESKSIEQIIKELKENENPERIDDLLNSKNDQTLEEYLQGYFKNATLIAANQSQSDENSGITIMLLKSKNGLNCYISDTNTELFSLAQENGSIVAVNTPKNDEPFMTTFASRDKDSAIKFLYHPKILSRTNIKAPDPYPIIPDSIKQIIDTYFTFKKEETKCQNYRK